MNLLIRVKAYCNFYLQVAILKKTRHENLALFMGACFDPPNLAIVTSFCQGYTLYKLVHYWSEVFLLERLVNIGRQIAQAMGYLHARGIIHKGLNSKNIFLEKTTDRKEKVIITDMGLSAFSNLLITGRPAKLDDSRCLLRLTHTQIYYLAPEIVRMISPHYQVDRDICPFTFATDMYSFGTILYELITRKYPFVTDSLGFGYETEVVLYLIGRGYKQPFKATDVPKQLKDIVWECWSTQPDDRPSFRELQERLARLCRKHTPITRSPSHPINLSKSVDNLLYI
jgi:kinase suppressor of Ras 2